MARTEGSKKFVLADRAVKAPTAASESKRFRMECGTVTLRGRVPDKKARSFVVVKRWSGGRQPVAQVIGLCNL